MTDVYDLDPASVIS